MELISFPVPKSVSKVSIAPLGDFQWSGKNGPTAADHLKRHIDHCLDQDAYFIGLGDFIDFMSPTNRRRLFSADLYDTAMEVISDKALELVDEVFENFLKPTVGRWICLTEGHHFYQAGDKTTDQIFAEKLKTTFTGTSVFAKIPRLDITLYAHHGIGAGQLPGVGLNKLYHTAAGLQGADIYFLGHNTKLATTRLSRPYPRWDVKPPRLEHRDIWLVNCGGFSKSNTVGHRVGSIPRGDYAESAMMTPSPLSAPIVTVDMNNLHDKIRVSI